MKYTRLALALMILAGPALADTGKVAVTPPAVVSGNVASPDQIWIVNNDETITPVVDAVSRHLAAAYQAFSNHQNKVAATELRDVAAALEKQVAAIKNAKQAHAQAGVTVPMASVKRLDSVIVKVQAAAQGLDKGTIKSRADLDKVLDKAARADLDQRWVITDVVTTYPLIEAPQYHFVAAAKDFANKDSHGAALEVRKATGLVRLEAARAAGDAKIALDKAVTQLDKLSQALDAGTVHDEKALDTVFATTEQALGLAHRSQAAVSWLGKDYRSAGHEMKAAANNLGAAAGWLGKEAKAGAMDTVHGVRSLGDKLISGGVWTRDEIGKGFDALGRGLNDVGHVLDIKQQAAPIKTSP